jgi:hypothetical protein
MMCDDRLMPTELDIADRVRVIVSTADLNNAVESMAAVELRAAARHLTAAPGFLPPSQKGEMTIALQVMLEVLESLPVSVVHSYPCAVVVAHVRAAAAVLGLR